MNDGAIRWRVSLAAAAVWVALWSLLTASGCATNPYTQRWQFLILCRSYEQDLGTQAYHQVLQDPKIQISRDAQEIEPVQRVASRIIAAAKQSRYAEIAQQFHWEISVIKDDKTMNAFALPGGKIAVYTGSSRSRRTKPASLPFWVMKSRMRSPAMARSG